MVYKKKEEVKEVPVVKKVVSKVENEGDVLLTKKTLIGSGKPKEIIKE